MKSSFLESSPRDLQDTLNRRVQGRRTFVAAAVDGASRCRARGETRYDETTPEIVSTSKNSQIHDSIMNTLGARPGGSRREDTHSTAARLERHSA